MHKNIKPIILFTSIVFLAAACNRQPAASKAIYLSANASIGGHKLAVQIAQSPDAQSQGLSGRDLLGTDDAMYFKFSQTGKYGFWMKDMKFPLDFIWVRDSKVVEITPKVEPEPGVPEASLHIYPPQELVDGIFEVNAGWVAQNQIKVGDAVELTP